MHPLGRFWLLTAFAHRLAYVGGCPGALTTDKHGFFAVLDVGYLAVVAVAMDSGFTVFGLLTTTRRDRDLLPLGCHPAQ